jgi:CRP-like cAMP-binding protein
MSSTETYEAGETIIKVGGAPTHVFLLLEGAVNLRLPAHPAEFGIVVSQIEKGELFGISPLLGSSRYTAAAQCAGASTVLAIEAKPLRALLKANPVVGFHIMTQVAQVYFSRYMSVLKILQGVVGQIALIR